MEKTYDLRGWTNATELLELLARKGGRLLRGGEPDLDGVAKMVLNDFMRGKIPWFTPAPSTGSDDVIPGRDGRLGEMPKKRTLEEASHGNASSESLGDDGRSDSEEIFEGFDSDSQAPSAIDSAAKSPDANTSKKKRHKKT
jgi:nuclear GTP-binding protein